MHTAITMQTGFSHLTDLPCVKLQFGEATAIISLYGAQVLSYQPTPGQELLWLSPLADWHQQTPIRGGVPICWPWFGPVDSRLNPHQQLLPNHGVVRTQLWRLDAEQKTAQSVSVTMKITVPNLPYHNDTVTLQVQLMLSDSLTISLRCDNTMLQQAALHSYFIINNLPQTRVQPLSQCYIDKVSAKRIDTAEAIAVFHQEVDRIYDATPDVLHISSAGHIINMTQQGQDATVVWNPWQEKSRHISDLPDDGYKEFICVETARLQLDAAAPLQLSQSLQCA